MTKHAGIEHEKMSHAEEVAKIHQDEVHHQRETASKEKIAAQKKPSNNQ
jgi:hypothetical protein